MMYARISTGLCLALAAIAPGQVSYSPMSLPGGNALKSDFGMLTGVSAADYDNDGDVDLFVPTKATFPNRLYRNTGDGTFEEVAAQAGVADPGKARISLFFDHNGDGLLDLIVGRDCHFTLCPELQSMTLYEQQPGGTFTDVTAGSGLEGHKSTSTGSHMAAFCAGDLNNDGWVDLVLAVWTGPIWIYLNNGGDGTFTDISFSSGISTGVSFYWQPVIADYNDDGWQDIFIGMDFLADELWLNQKDGTFVNAAADAACDIGWNGMGVSIGDIENDGDWDIYCTNISIGTSKWSCLYDNTGGPASPTFLESAVPLKADAAGWGWGCTFFDYDLDTHVDLAVTNGRTGGNWQNDPSKLFRNAIHETGAFADVSNAAGFNDTFVGATVIAADLDRDGDLELIQTSVNDGGGSTNGQIRLLESNAADIGAGNWLVVRPRMTGPNSQALGAVVRVSTSGASQMRVITAGTSMQGQEPAEAHFGLGSATTAQKVIIEWPHGLTTVLSGVAAGQVIDITAPLCSADLDASGQVDSTDLNAVLAAFGSPGPSGDVEGDGFVGSTDLNAVLAKFGSACGN